MVPRTKSPLGQFCVNLVPFLLLVVGVVAYWWFWSYVLYRSFDPFTPNSDGGFDPENPKLLEYIDSKFLTKTIKWRSLKDKPSKIPNQLIPPRIYNLLEKSFENQNVGFYVEYAPQNSSITGFLEGYRQWYGLIIEPNPIAYTELKASDTTRSAWLTPVCLSKSQPEKKFDSIFDITIECFPLFPVLAALEETTVDLLVFNASDAWDLIEFIPFHFLRIRMILIRGIEPYKKPEFDGLMKKTKYFKKSEDQEDYALYLNNHDYNLYSN